MANDKVCKKYVKGHGQGHMFKFYVPPERSCHKKYCSMPNMKALSVRIRKLWPKLKFFKSRSNVT